MRSSFDDPSIHPRLSFASQAFGLRWGSDHRLRQFASTTNSAPFDVVVVRDTLLRERFGGRPVNNGEVYADGARFRFGNVVFDTFGESRVRWWSPEPIDEMPAAFYGTVAAIILAWRRLVPLHGSAVALGDRAVMIAGAAGAGKSTLCAALIRRGGRLVSDDLTVLMPTGEGARPMLQPGRPTIRLASGGSNGNSEKSLHDALMVDPQKSINLAALVVLRENPVGAGAAEASAALWRQLFRPVWMRALPYRRERAATVFQAAQGIRILTAPRAEDRPDLSADQKAGLVLERLREESVMELSR